MKSRMPKWMKTLLMFHKPSIYTGIQAKNMDLATVGTQTAFFGWLGRSMADIQAILDNLNLLNGATSGANASRNSGSAYQYDMMWSHRWRNNSNGPVVLRFWKLYPRRDMPAKQTGMDFPGLTPAFGYGYGDCLVQDPNGWTQPFLDMATPVGALNFTASHLGVTPFMNPSLVRAFKVKKCYVQFEGRKQHNVTMKQGTECGLTVKKLRPYAATFSKFGMISTQANSIGQAYQCLKETPLIMIQMEGIIVHDSLNLDRINKGIGYIEYMVERKGRILISDSFGLKRHNPYGAATAFAGVPMFGELVAAAQEEEKETA